jgi:hypothetical protein
MISKLYLVIGTLLIVAFVQSTRAGVGVMGYVFSKAFSPKGGPSGYHK